MLTAPIDCARSTLAIHSGTGDVVSKPSTLEEPTAEQKFVLKPPIRREDLLQFTEDDPEGAEEFLELLREFREDRQPRPDPT